MADRKEHDFDKYPTNAYQDFDVYRACFYWFQLHYALRADNPGNGTIVSFLQDLCLSPDCQHERWEPKTQTPVVFPDSTPVIARPPRGMNQKEAMRMHKAKLDAMPVSTHKTVYMGKIPGKSIRHRFMLFDYLRTKRNKLWHNFNGLYRALLALDLHNAGRSFSDIAENWGREEYYLLTDLTEHRKHTIQDHVFEIAGMKPFENRFLAPSRFSENFVNAISSDNGLSALKIKRHYSRAKDLTKLAATGHFKSLSLLPSID